MIDPLQFLGFYTIMFAGLLMFYYFVRHARKRAVVEASTQVFGMARRVTRGFQLGKEPSLRLHEGDAVRMKLLSRADREFLFEVMGFALKRTSLGDSENRILNEWLDLIPSTYESD